MFRRLMPAAGGRLGWVIALALVLVAFMTARQAHTQAAPAAAAQAAAPTRMFTNDAAMVLNFVKSDKTADFEEVMGKLKEALAKSDKPERKQQAAGWKIFKSPEPQGANTLYVFVVDPAVKGADYTVSNILTEGLGNNAETNAILTKYAGAYANPAMNFVNLQILQELGK